LYSIEDFEQTHIELNFQHEFRHRPQPDRPFLSRNFSSPRQWGQFFLRALQLETQQSRRRKRATPNDEETTTATAAFASTITAATNGNGRKKGNGKATVDGEQFFKNPFSNFHFFLQFYGLNFQAPP
jgi:hypothetical protein